MTANSKQVNSYDAEHDVLHVFLGSQRGSSADEEMPGVYVNRNDDTDEIVGFTVLDFRKNMASVQSRYPQYSFHAPDT